MKKLNKSQGKNKEVDLDNLPLYDCIQEQEDDWVSSVLGSNTDAFRDLFSCQETTKHTTTDNQT